VNAGWQGEGAEDLAGVDVEGDHLFFALFGVCEQLAILGRTQFQSVRGCGTGGKIKSRPLDAFVDADDGDCCAGSPGAVIGFEKPEVGDECSVSVRGQLNFRAVSRRRL
jgi:hypothetical protein